MHFTIPTDLYVTRIVDRIPLFRILKFSEVYYYYISLGLGLPPVCRWHDVDEDSRFLFEFQPGRGSFY